MAPGSLLTLADIEAARERIARGIYMSPLRRVDPAVATDRRADLLQARLPARTGSCKERGARNALEKRALADSGVTVVA